MNKKVFFSVLAGTLALLFLICGICIFLLWSSVSNICDSLDLKGLKPGDYNNTVNILAIGVDGDETRTDTIMLCSMDMEEKKVSLLSIPRDTRVKSGGKWDKINHLYGYDPTGQLTLDAVKDITGAEINYMAIINFNGFNKVIDKLGGVEIEVPDLGKGGMYYDDPYQDLHIALPAGKQILNGEEAQGFVRFRSGYANADLARVENQRYLISQLVKQKFNAAIIPKVPGIINSLEGDLHTNYSCQDMMSQLIRMVGMNSDDIFSYTLPGDSGMASTRYGTLSCFMYEEDETDRLIKEHFTDN